MHPLRTKLWREAVARDADDGERAAPREHLGVVPRFGVFWACPGGRALSRRRARRREPMAGSSSSPFWLRGG